MGTMTWTEYYKWKTEIEIQLFRDRLETNKIFRLLIKKNK